MDKVLEKLKMPTPASEIKYRVGTIYDKEKGKATVLSYVDARYVQDTLDSLVGPENWENRFYEAKGALFCEITINLGSVKISKSDCGTESEIAPAKGEASDAFKRAAVMFGIGRDLYSVETHFADLEKKGSKWVLPRDWKPENKPTKRSGNNMLEEEAKMLQKSPEIVEVSKTIKGKLVCEDMKLFFGKNKDKMMSKCDGGYLKWLSGSAGKENLEGWLKDKDGFPDEERINLLQKTAGYFAWKIKEEEAIPF